MGNVQLNDQREGGAIRAINKGCMWTHLITTALVLR